MGTPAGLLFAAVVALLSVAGASADWDSDDDPVSTVQVDGVLGRSVSLPCDIEPATRDDRVYMVLWFKENAGKPMYSFDVRGRPFNQALYWSDAKSPGPRAYFATSSRPASLTLETVQLDNEGTYRCRVDFKDSPTRNSVVNLTVIVPPYQLFIYDNSGRPLVSAVVGPLTEGAQLTLSCEVRGGKPPPTVSWFVNDKMADAAVAQMGRGVAVSKLEVGGVGRSDLNSTFKCQASNTKLVLPVEKSVRLELYLRPLSVVLADRPASLEAGLEAALVCEAAGSRPPAQVTWWRDARSLRRGKLETTASETLVTSVLRFAPSPDDDGHVIKCHAENPSIPGSGLEDSLTLSVVYAPLVALRLGNTLNSADIKEGDDVYFECDVRANPREHKIAWRHDGRAVTQNVTSGVILSTRSLVLQGVTRHSGGSYACSAANGRGETSSEAVALRVQYAPVCDSSEVSVIGASLGEALRVRCRVSADPGDVLFEWQFNNSGESISVPAARFASGNASGGASSVSELNYAPTTDRDYGTLACWARNAIGRQAEPCVFQVVSAGPALPGTARCGPRPTTAAPGPRCRRCLRCWRWSAWRATTAACRRPSCSRRTSRAACGCGSTRAPARRASACRCTSCGPRAPARCTSSCSPPTPRAAASRPCSRTSRCATPRSGQSWRAWTTLWDWAWCRWRQRSRARY
ncbi:synaptogenesis protein syg-2-like isoform X2 [Bacillus rossius redtenbacheri]|uniref:synaptogenesis protein syg-2-like isoform X2 n=1 Tax=Bacillus rossius redtenbacheri TaxID=93214 RepID=UPI002FDE43C3